MAQSFVVSEEMVRNTITFLSRVDLKGGEVPAFNSVVAFINGLNGSIVSRPTQEVVQEAVPTGDGASQPVSE